MRTRNSAGGAQKRKERSEVGVVENLLQGIRECPNLETHRFILFTCVMAARDSQQWYIEEIPPIEQDDEPGEACGRPPVSVQSEDGDTAPKAFITLDTGEAATLDTPQTKVEATVRNKETLTRW